MHFNSMETLPPPPTICLSIYIAVANSNVFQYLTFLNCMTKFIRLLVVALVDDDDVEV